MRIRSLVPSIRSLVNRCLAPSAVATSLVAAFVLTAGVAAPSSSEAQLKKVCRKVVRLGGWQYKNNSPIRASAALSSPITRFALNPTLIFIGSNPTRLNAATVYDRRGNKLFTAPRLYCAVRKGACLARYKANEITANTRKMRQLAMRRAKSPAFYWKVANNLCVEVPDGGKCYGVQRRGFCSGQTVG